MIVPELKIPEDERKTEDHRCERGEEICKEVN